ncbi:THUMP domain-containing protein [Methanobacterium ferruginis]|uniref:THUMP domain-containing protein n=1 Tax=Methanobacterium ferruginis TaxID=710191 RepID=UPI0025741287|nr:THUMP domain-containing protein [Methanobacterium ferruginis]BDZ66758.1 hypothetical protein GCM10025860_02060 [Methanobacterium ferruginis]
MGEELVGIEELELALQNHEKILNIKESEFPNVILIDLSMDPLEAIKLIASYPTTVISKVVPIETVVRTRLDSILEKIIILTRDKLSPGDKFNVICDLRGENTLNLRMNYCREFQMN